jgi:acyl-[acyl-carrier-protein]-phospholipid O-acyltransferase/long-chain-fatty-acid--[acyl-carrier-protein] ligase
MPDELSAADHSSPDSQPGQKAASFFRDRSFHGLAISQFLGAFNDNLFKQLVLLLCVDQARATGKGAADLQPLAMVVFAVPWLLFSGLAGVFSDRGSKRNGIVLFKSLEIAVMAAGLLAFLSGQLWLLLVVLFLMSMQSTFFGPPKYGILPELFRGRQLPKINGLFQMTTFVAIILGMAIAGFARDRLPGQTGLAWTSAGAIAVALIGTAAALLIRRTPVAQPDLRISWRSVAIDPENWQLLKSDRFLRGVVFVSACFWFSGAVVQQAVNSFGKRQLHLSDTRTSLLAACMAVGIAVGCVLGGQLSKNRIRFGLVRIGAWGLIASLTFMVLIPDYFSPSIEFGPHMTLWYQVTHTHSAEWYARCALTAVGLFGGLFIVPLQTCLQSVPPDSQKGRMIATMNFASWIGILLSAAFYAGVDWLRRAASLHLDLHIPHSATFGALALVLLPIAIWYRPADRELG